VTAGGDPSRLSRRILEKLLLGGDGRAWGTRALGEATDIDAEACEAVSGLWPMSWKT
jgi:hypothetical protein